MSVIKAIEARALELGMDESEVALHIGTTEPYWRVFRRGGRPIALIGHEKLKVIAEFIGKPLVSVYIMAGILQPNDFVNTVTLSERLTEALNSIRTNSSWRLFAPSDEDWAKTPQCVKLLTVLLYEQLTMEELLDRASSVNSNLHNRRASDSDPSSDAAPAH